MNSDTEELDQVFYAAWSDFQKENWWYQTARLTLNDGLHERLEWKKLCDKHPRFSLHLPVREERLQEWAGRLEREEEARDCNALEALEAQRGPVADVAAGAALGLALSRARVGKKTSLRAMENMHRAMVVSLQIVAAAVAIFAAALVGFHFGRQAVFDQLPAAQQQEIWERTNSFFNTVGD